MVVLQHIAAPDGVAAGSGYSQVVTGRGRLVVHNPDALEQYVF